MSAEPITVLWPVAPKPLPPVDTLERTYRRLLDAYWRGQPGVTLWAVGQARWAWCEAQSAQVEARLRGRGNRKGVA